MGMESLDGDNNERGSKRKDPEGEETSSSPVVATSDPTISRPLKKQAVISPVAENKNQPESLTEQKSVVNDEDKKSSTAAKVEDATTLSSTAKTDKSSKDELILEWTNFTAQGEEKVFSVSADELIAQGKSLCDTSEVKQNDKGECEERNYTLKLVDANKKAASNSDKAASLSFAWWKNGAHANLMNFNILTQDLADFSFVLWCAAGRNRRQYNDMAIEFGESPHSLVEVNELIADACSDGNVDTIETAYLDYVTVDPESGASKEQGLRLLNGLIALVGQTSNLIAHQSDLDKLQIGFSTCRELGLETLGNGRGQNQWYVRTAVDIL